MLVSFNLFLFFEFLDLSKECLELLLEVFYFMLKVVFCIFLFLVIIFFILGLCIVVFVVFIKIAFFKYFIYKVLLVGVNFYVLIIRGMFLLV